MCTLPDGLTSDTVHSILRTEHFASCGILHSKAGLNGPFTEDLTFEVVLFDSFPSTLQPTTGKRCRVYYRVMISQEGEGRLLGMKEI